MDSTAVFVFTVLLFIVASPYVSGTISEVVVRIQFYPRKILSGADYEVGCYVTQDIAKPITYKWQLNSKDIPGETNTLSVTAGDKADEKLYNYTCTATDRDGAISQSAAKLFEIIDNDHDLATPSIEVQPRGHNYDEAEEYTLQCHGGTQYDKEYNGMMYKWYKDGKEISGEIGMLHKVKDTSTSASYTCKTVFGGKTSFESPAKTIQGKKVYVFGPHWPILGVEAIYKCKLNVAKDEESSAITYLWSGNVTGTVDQVDYKFTPKLDNSNRWKRTFKCEATVNGEKFESSTKLVPAIELLHKPYVAWRDHLGNRVLLSGPRKITSGADYMLECRYMDKYYNVNTNVTYSWQFKPKGGSFRDLESCTTKFCKISKAKDTDAGIHTCNVKYGTTEIQSEMGLGVGFKTEKGYECEEVYDCERAVTTGYMKYRHLFTFNCIEGFCECKYDKTFDACSDGIQPIQPN